MKQEEMSPSELAKMTVVYSIPGMESVTVRRDLAYRETESGPLTFDVYYPPGAAAGDRRPAVLIVHGYSDAGMPNVFGRSFKEMGQTVSWAQLIAASGLVAILYSNREPVDDVQRVLQHLHEDAADLGIDETRLGLWAASGNVPLAVWLLMQPDRCEIRCAVLWNGYMLDLNGATSVADMQKVFPFVNPGAGKTMDDVRNDVPLLVVRAGRDQFGVNTSLDAFIAGALQKDLPMRMINHAGAPHAFDLFEDSEATREIIREILRFTQVHLSGPPKGGHYIGAKGGHYTGAKGGHYTGAEAGHLTGSNE